MTRRGKRRSADSEPGKVLGLLLIELHGGRMWVESKVGVGSTFAFTLPSTIATRDAPA